jgi:hypothetical protein
MRSVWAANKIAAEFEYTRDPLLPAAAAVGAPEFATKFIAM